MCAMQIDQQVGRRAMFARSELDIFDRNPDPALDELTELAATLCSAEYAYIGLMDFNRIWFKSQFGFSALDQPRSAAACQWVVETAQPLLVLDAADDPRFPPTGLPIPNGKPCRSYAGVPILSIDQRIIGSFAVLAWEPRRLTPDHVRLLEALGRQVSTRFELYKRIRAQERAQRVQRRIERALAVEQLFVAATLDSIPALVAVLDTAGRVVRFNQPCAQLTGWNVEEAAGRRFFDQILHETDQSWIVSKLQGAALGTSSGPHESTWRVAQGFHRRVSWTLRPLKSPAGDVQYLIVTGQDITEQREAEKALLTSEARYQQVVESSLGFVFTSTMDGRLTSLNAFTAETLGYRAEELTGRRVTDLLDPAGAVAFEECLHTLDLRDESQGSFALRRHDGSYRYIAFRCRRMQLRGERPFVLIHGVDVTEQHEIEAALQHADRQRELVLEAVADGICGLDLEGKITFINEAGARALGHEPRELTGRDFTEVTHHSNGEATLYTRETSPVLGAIREQTQVHGGDEYFWRADGSSFPVEYTANPLIEDGRVAGMVVAFQDVSERRLLEKMKDEFISTVSHELRTPLTSLRASLGLLSTAALTKQPERQRQMIEMAIDNCDRLVRLVNDIVDFDKFQHGRMALRRVPVEALDLLRRAADVAQPSALEARINFRIDAQTALVMADEDRILQVLNELVANAIKFSPEQTLIRLGALPMGEQKVCFLVEDQGKGIPSEKLESIFERFEQGDASDTRALGGTGLGLALCRKIIEQHDGRIWAESTPGRGSRFLFTLPRATHEA